MLSKMEIIFLVKVTVKEILTICVSSDSKEENGKILKQRTCHHEDVEDGMHPFLLNTKAVENGTDAVGDAADEQQQKSCLCHNMPGLLPEGDDGPAHTDVADHGKHFVFLQVDRRQGGSNQSQRPFKDEQSPAQDWIDRPATLMTTFASSSVSSISPSDLYIFRPRSRTAMSWALK